MDFNYDLNKRDFERKLDAMKDILSDISCLLTEKENEILKAVVDEYEYHLEQTIVELKDGYDELLDRLGE